MRELANINDDKDIKIFEKISTPSHKESQSDEIKQELESIRESGKAEIARRLGYQLALCLHEQKGLHQFGADDCEASNIGVQRKILLAFCVDTVIVQSGLGNVLEGILINSFYDNIKLLDPVLYNDIRQSGAWSFYYLALRRGGDVECRIAKTFAMLCGYDGNHIFQEYGEALYSKFTNTVLKKIEKSGIKDT